MDFIKKNLGRIQDQIKEISIIIKNKNSKVKGIQSKDSIRKNIDYGLTDKEYTDKSDKIKVIYYYKN
jgi:hypothetical protein